MKHFSMCSAAALGLGLAIPVTANTITVDYTPFVDTGWVNSGSLPPGWAEFGPAAAVVTGSLFDVYQAPTGDSTAYDYVGPNSFIIGNFAPTAVFSLYWGSADTFNAIAFTDINGDVTTYGFNGEAIPGLSLGTNTSAYVTFEDSGPLWTEVEFTSGATSFEFDDISPDFVTPEPASIALLAGGLVAIGAGALRRRKR